MPDAIVKILKLTPFYYMQNVSFNIYNGYITDMKEIVKIIILQLIWFVILSILGKKMMNKQIKRVFFILKLIFISKSLIFLAANILHCILNNSISCLCFFLNFEFYYQSC